MLTCHEMEREFTIVVCTGIGIFIFAVRTLLLAIAQLAKRNALSPVTEAIHLGVLITLGQVGLWP